MMNVSVKFMIFLFLYVLIRRDSGHRFHFIRRVAAAAAAAIIIICNIIFVVFTLLFSTYIGHISIMTSKRNVLIQILHLVQI